MERWRDIQTALREFEGYLSDRVPKPFTVVPADDTEWAEGDRAARTPPGYPYTLTGVYLYFDVCTAGDIHAKPVLGEPQYCVLRKIGSATNHFYDRVRKAHWSDNGTRLWFTHRWIDIIPVPADLGFVTLALEDFLLQRVRSEMDARRVPKRLRCVRPTIYPC
jgi:hypothetical protein